ncbi:MAG: type II secretion system F family protein [Firmicutes bacterium]|nr:type II secretion system F family protein [Bacillota bacterium]
MALFAYEVITKTGELLKGQLEAADEYAVADNLRKIGHTVIDIVEIKPSFFQNAFKAKVKASVGDLSLLCRQLAAMLDAGVPLTRSLFTLSIQTTNKGLGRILEEIARNIEGGMSFTDAISAYPHIFPSIFSGMVKAGEVGGTLEEALGRLADQLQKDKFLRDSLRSATFYPAAIGIFSVLLLLGMLFFLVPLFMGFFPPGTPLPLPTKIVVALSNSLRSLWYLWFLTVFLLAILLRTYLRSPLGKQQWDRLKFRLPLFGPLFHRAVIARFSRTLSTLFSGGIPVVQALEAAGAATGNSLVEEAAKEAAEKVQEGKSIAGPLGESPVFPPMVTQMVSIGEESGSLPDLLNRIADFFEEEVAVMTKGLTGMLEPIMLIVVGLLVGSMLLALYMPIFSVITQGM